MALVKVNAKRKDEPGAPPLEMREVEARLLAHLAERAAGSDGTQALTLLRADAAVVAGARPEEAEAALRALSARYRSHLSVTEQGELVYEFAPGLVRRDEQPLAERLGALSRTVGRALWATFTVGFKIWIAATLVLYSVVFAILGLALSLASEDDSPGFIFWWLLPDFGPNRDMEDADGRPRKRFHRSVFDFVFGPPPLRPPALPDDRELLAHVRAQKGRITATDLVLLRGLDYRRAEEEATRLLARYDGEPEVAEGGTLVYTFRDLRRTALPDAPETPRLAPAPALLLGGGAGWVTLEEMESSKESTALALPRTVSPASSWRHEGEPPLTGNRTGSNVAITALGGFNLLASLTIGPWAALILGLGALGTVLLTVAPLIFSVVFFSVPLARMGVRAAGRRKRRRRNARRALLIAIGERGGEPVEREALLRRAREVLRESTWAWAEEHGERARLDPDDAYRPILERELDRLMQELEGDVAMAEGASGARDVRLEFPRMREEMAAARAARQLAPAEERSAGEVVFSSHVE
jgi:hypothetical protein